MNYLRSASLPGRRGLPITLDTEIHGDLGLYGDDLWELANWLHKEFRVAGAFPLTRYGPGEMPHLSILLRLKKLLGLKQVAYESLTVRSVLSVIEAGKWPT
ncbi:MAG: DUF1493 family protein [Proteobacteria bacterium]|nr:DUF1493 family protein [Pseudomonadota bacterium]